MMPLCLRQIGLATAIAAVPCAFALGQAVCPQEPGPFVAYGGKAQYKLGDAKLIPPGELVSLTGHPLPPRLPLVTVRRADEPVAQRATVTEDTDGCGWTAALPSLPPNVKAEIRVTGYTKPNDEQLARITRTFTAMLGTLFAGIGSRAIPTGGVSPAVFTAAARDHLAAAYKPESTLVEFVLVRPDGTAGMLGGVLVDIIAESDSLVAADVFTSYVRHVQALEEILLNSRAIDQLPTAERNAVRQFVGLVGPDYFPLSGVPIRRARVEQLLTRRVPLLPLIPDARAGLMTIVQGMTLEPGARDQRLASIDTLSMSLERRLPGLYAAMLAARTDTYQLGTINGPMWMGDLLRFGTVDYVAGQVSKGAGGPGAAQENVGLLTLSFFPNGPQARTPGQYGETPAVSGRYALSVGYSVTSSGENGSDYLFGGLTGRFNRYLSATVGLVSPPSGGKFRCCFVGVAGDLSALPFLNNIFAVNPAPDK